jgi:hypothetical protein
MALLSRRILRAANIGSRFNVQYSMSRVQGYVFNIELKDSARSVPASTPNSINRIPITLNFEPAFTYNWTPPPIA